MRRAGGSTARGAAALVGRRRLLLAGILVVTLAVSARAFQLQVLQASAWKQRAEEQQYEQLKLAAPRGIIYDRNGVPLAASRDVFRIALAPREVTDAGATAAALEEVLGMNARESRALLTSKRRWIVLPARYGVAERYRLDGLPGVYFERVQERFYPHGDLALGLLGSVAADGHAVGGIELEFDSILRGTAGLAVVRRDARGTPIPGALVTAIDPVAGRDVYLTIDLEMQEIAKAALNDAMEKTQARGGDVLITDPRTGELLAAVSRRGSASRPWQAVTETFEPGSTMKPFFVAALLADGRATLGDSVYGEKGSYAHNGRTVSDVHAYEWLTLRDALRVSSNVAMVKMSARLDQETQYRYLRDFGFGSPTGISYPSESAGMLWRPRSWSGMSQGSLAMGYEISVTPLQLAMAYGALANGGVLLEPRVVRETRTRDGRTIMRREPRALRRVVPETVSRDIATVMAAVVDSGTAQAADLGTFQVAGKTGTARRAVNGRYVAGAYTASFAGFFPADDPQLVIMVKLDSPKGAYYGGVTAAPVTRATLSAALAARRTPLDRSAVVTRMEAPHEVFAPAPSREPLRSRATVVALTSKPLRPEVEETGGVEPLVPDVTGMPLRDAARVLRGAGFRVSIAGSGPATVTDPIAGAPAALGSIIRVIGGSAE